MAKITTLSIATRAMARLTANSGVGDLCRMHALAERDGVGFWHTAPPGF